MRLFPVVKDCSFYGQTEREWALYGTIYGLHFIEEKSKLKERNWTAFFKEKKTLAACLEIAIF